MKLKDKLALTWIIPVVLVSFMVTIGAAPARSQNAGSLPIWLGWAKSNSVTGCYSLTNGWDRYMVVTNIFIGPDYSLGQFPAGAILNPSHYTNLMLNLCNSTNGSELVGELYVINNANPNDGEAKCGTNDPNCTFNTNSSSAIIKMTNTSSACYRVSVVYKSSTTNGLTNIVVNWAYTNL